MKPPRRNQVIGVRLTRCCRASVAPSTSISLIESIVLRGPAYVGDGTGAQWLQLTDHFNRFDRVFLIRAAGRSAPEILAELDRRLGNDDAAEREETVTQLREIALLRLRQVAS